MSASQASSRDDARLRPPEDSSLVPKRMHVSILASLATSTKKVPFVSDALRLLKPPSCSPGYSAKRRSVMMSCKTASPKNSSR